MQALRRTNARRSLAWSMILLLAATSLAPGCRWQNGGGMFGGDPDMAYYQSVATDIEMPDVPSDGSGVQQTVAPLTLSADQPVDYWSLSLQECVQLALTNSQVMRDLGGLVLQSPQNVDTVYGPAILETDPRFGVDAALSAFDASFSTSAFFENNDRPLNNPFFIGGRTLKQDLGVYNTEISKTTAQGSEFTLRHFTDYDANNTPGNPFPQVWNTMFETEMRQPLLRGFGAPFNRAAGPGSTSGVYNGVLVARINTDMSLADFEMGVRNLVSDIESTYWELYFGYRDLDAKLAARQRGLETWRRIHALNVTGRQGGESDKEAQAREQYYRLDEEVQNALAGRLQDRTRTFTFRGVGGIQNNERRLRWLMGIPINDGRLIRPADEPLMAKVVFDWNETIAEAMMRRAELRKQKWLIKRSELELMASRNFLLPRLDAIALYRWRGFGQNLLNPDPNKPQFDNAWGDLTSGDFQEWQMGFEYEFPIGYRQAHAGVRSAELTLARERAILREQERDVSLGLSEALADLDRAYEVAQTNFNRRRAALDALSSFEAKYQVADENQKTQLLALVLDAQRQVADAESRYYRSLVEYTLAVKQVHYQKGSLLDYSEVVLSEGAWPDKAYRDAARREELRGGQWQLMNFLVPRRLQVSQGGYGQQTASPEPERVYYPYDGTSRAIGDEGQENGATGPAAGSLDGGGQGTPGGPAPPQPLPTPPVPTPAGNFPGANERQPGERPPLVREAIRTAGRRGLWQSPSTAKLNSSDSPNSNEPLSSDGTFQAGGPFQPGNSFSPDAPQVYRLDDQPQSSQVRPAAAYQPLAPRGSLSDTAAQPAGGDAQGGGFYGAPSAQHVVKPNNWYEQGAAAPGEGLSSPASPTGWYGGRSSDAAPQSPRSWYGAGSNPPPPGASFQSGRATMSDGLPAPSASPSGGASLSDGPQTGGFYQPPRVPFSGSSFGDSPAQPSAFAPANRAALGDGTY